MLLRRHSENIRVPWHAGINNVKAFSCLKKKKERKKLYLTDRKVMTSISVPQRRMVRCKVHLLLLICWVTVTQHSIVCVCDEQCVKVCHARIFGCKVYLTLMINGFQSNPQQKSWDQTAVFACKQGIYLLFVFSQLTCVSVCQLRPTEAHWRSVCIPRICCQIRISGWLLRTPPSHHTFITQTHTLPDSRASWLACSIICIWKTTRAPAFAQLVA